MGRPRGRWRSLACAVDTVRRRFRSAALTWAAAVPTLLGGDDAEAQSLPAPGTPPPGANDPGCRPTAAHPDPVVLVHGSFGDMTGSWNLISPVLRGLRCCVFALDYGHRGPDPVERSAAELGAFVDRVLAATSASHVLVVGHSQGGMMPRYWMRFLGGAARVRGVVGLAPSNHGTTIAAAPAAAGGGCASCAEQQAGPALLTRLNARAATLTPRNPN